MACYRILLLPLLATPLLLSGCVDLRAVGTYSGTAGQVVSDRSALNRWYQSEQLLRARRLEGDKCPIGRSGRPPQAEFDAAFAQAGTVHEVLGRYYLTLAELATGQPPTPSQALEGSLSAIHRVGVPVTPEDEAALRATTTLLSRSLDGLRHLKVRATLESTYDAVDRLLQLLQRLATVYRDEVNGERIQATQFVRCAIATGDLADGYLGRRELQQVQLDYQRELAALDRYRQNLDRVRANHARIHQAIGGHDTTQLLETFRTLNDTRHELESAQSALHALKVTPTAP
jgi:hypothetical protein